MFPKLYFVGGIPLSGKSEVTTQFLRKTMSSVDKIPQCIGTDGIRRILWTTITDSEEPTLFQMHNDRRTWTEEQWITNVQADPSCITKRQYHESEVVWRRGIKPLLECNIDRALPTLIEGVVVQPSFLADFPFPHAAVFVGNNKITDLFRAEIYRIAQTLPDHWMRTWSKRKIDTYLDYVLPDYAQRLQRNAEQHGYPYFDLSSGNYQELQQQAANQLAIAPFVIGRTLAA